PNRLSVQLVLLWESVPVPGALLREAGEGCCGGHWRATPMVRDSTIRLPDVVTNMDPQVQTGTFTLGLRRGRRERGIKRRNVSKTRPSNRIMKHLLALLVIAPLGAQTPEQLEARGVSVANATYQGKSAVRLDALPNAANGESYAIVKGSHFQNGTIEIE